MPEEWLREMRGRSNDGEPVPSDSKETHAKPSNENAQRPIVKRHRVVDADEDYEQGNSLFSLRSLSISFLAALLATLAFYYRFYRVTNLKPTINHAIMASVTVDGTIMDVYDYISTADFRTEWHFRSIEISGPAIDHSAIPGEVFTEILTFGGREITVEWDVAERQIPTSASSNTAEFVLHGVTTPLEAGGKPDHWREVLRLRAGRHVHAGTPQVTVEVALESAQARKDGGDAAKRLRRRMQRSLKSSVALIRDRLDERRRSAKAS